MTYLFTFLIDAHRWIGSLLTALICKCCDYVQLFVNPKDFYLVFQQLLLRLVLDYC